MLGAVNFGHDQMQTVIDVIIALAERCAKEPRDVPAPAPEVGQVKAKLLAGGILDKFSEAYTEVDKQARQGKFAAVREGAVASLTDEEKDIAGDIVKESESDGVRGKVRTGTPPIDAPPTHKH